MSEKDITYQQALEELEEIVQRLEDEEVEVDRLSELVERATYLVNTCRDKLKSTEDHLNDTLQ